MSNADRSTWQYPRNEAGTVIGWSDDGKHLENRLINGIGNNFETAAKAELAHVPAALDSFRTSGYSTPGDGGGALYKRVATEPLHTGKIQSADGAWWEEAEPPMGLVSLPTLFRQPDIVLLGTGQSNALGADAGGDTTSNPNVLVWNGSEWVMAQIGQPPFNPNGDNNFTFHAAKYLQEATGRTVRIFLVAQGSLAIERWLESDPDHFMWDQIVSEVPAGLVAAGLSCVDRVFWHQGESNFDDGLLVYLNKLKTVKEQMRSQSWWLEGHTTMLVGELTQGGRGSFSWMNPALRMAADDGDDIGIVSSRGLARVPTELMHFTGEALVELGHRYARAALLPAPAVPRISRVPLIENVTTMSLKKSGVRDFSDVNDAIEFISSVKVRSGSTLTLLIGAGEWVVNGQAGLRLHFDNPNIHILGEVAEGFTSPTVSDFTGNEAVDLAMLQSKYLTEIVTDNRVFTVNGFGGFLKQLLLRTTAASGTHGISFREPSIVSINGGRVRLDRVALHGFTGSGSRAITADVPGCVVDASSLVISHCAGGIFASQSQIYAPNAVMAYVSAIKVQASAMSSINVANLDIVGGGSVAPDYSYLSATGSGIVATGGDDTANSSTVTDGKIWT